tara:strand:+ start:3887 stop:4210 length:324 start_codon:yes stop_codon:yes gene_type:complete
MEIFTFEKDKTNRWYVVLPEWTGDKSELEMVLGADIFLDILAQGETQVNATMSTEPFEGFKYTLTFINYEGGGGNYHLQSEYYDFPVWLCEVTKFVFGDLPENIYVG